MSGVVTFHQSVIEHYLNSSICQLKAKYDPDAARLLRVEVPECLRALWVLPESITDMSVGCLSALKKLTPLLNGSDDEREVRRELASICCPSAESSWDRVMVGDLEVRMDLDEVLWSVNTLLYSEFLKVGFFFQSRQVINSHWLNAA